MILVPLSSVSILLLMYNYMNSVVNLYKLFRQRGNHSKSEKILFKQLDILHAKTKNMHAYL